MLIKTKSKRFGVSQVKENIKFDIYRICIHLFFIRLIIQIKEHHINKKKQTKQNETKLVNQNFVLSKLNTSECVNVVCGKMLCNHSDPVQKENKNLFAYSHVL